VTARRKWCGVELQFGHVCTRALHHYGDHDPVPELPDDARCVFYFDGPRQRCVMPGGHRGDHLRRWVEIVRLRDSPEPVDVPDLSTMLVACQWCGHQGAPITEVEFVITGSGEKKRCADRDLCRARVAKRVTA
jgi:hypothetical protein